MVRLVKLFDYVVGLLLSFGIELLYTRCYRAVLDVEQAGGVVDTLILMNNQFLWIVNLG